MIDSDNIFRYGEDQLTLGLAHRLCQGKLSGVLTTAALNALDRSISTVKKIVNDHETVYGINTGFGAARKTKIEDKDILTLQANLLRSHSVGVGEDIPEHTARMMLILKIQALAKGYSGVSPELLERMIWHLDNNIIPCVPSQGSVGASGDLAPLAHLFLPLIGEGFVLKNGVKQRTEDVLKLLGIAPLTLGPKEGLALINGTQFIAAHAVEVLIRFQNCLDHADIIGALSLESLQGSCKPFQAELHHLRPFLGGKYVANRLLKLLTGSQVMEDHEHCNEVQDPYSLRCMPQVHGASRDAWLHAKSRVECELNSVTDNPIIVADEAISGGNFHGQPIALPIDYVTLAASELGNIADRRIYLLLKGRGRLPQLLMTHTGLNSGFMILQYTTAALASENKGLCFPSSADSIPTSLGQEDHVSMGSIGARKALQVVDNLEKILGIELLCAAQAFDFRGELKSSVILEEIHAAVRENIPYHEKDDVFSHSIETAIELIRNKSLINRTKAFCHEHNFNLPNDEDETFGIF
ncbi:MAG: histidine ammonia-lyase [Bacteroidota bacterium]